jgi:hypothetical protein
MHKSVVEGNIHFCMKPNRVSGQASPPHTIRLGKRLRVNPTKSTLMVGKAVSNQREGGRERERERPLVADSLEKSYVLSIINRGQFYQWSKLFLCIERACGW